MIVAVFTNVRGIACFQIFTPRNPALGDRKSAAKELRGPTSKGRGGRAGGRKGGLLLRAGREMEGKEWEERRGRDLDPW